MRLVCSYCRKVIRHDAGTRVLDVSHGMCPACADHHGKTWDGASLSEHLEALSEPVIVLDGEGRVIGANAKLGHLVGRARGKLPGLLCGEAFACVHSRLRERCGKTAFCRECTVRGIVTRVHRSGEPVRMAPAWVETDDGRLELLISASAEQGLVKLALKKLERAPAGKGEG